MKLIQSCKKSNVICLGSYARLLKVATLQNNEEIINLLFDAIANPLGLMCKNKLPFEICKEDASKLINFKLNVPLEIQRSANADAVKSSINDYFHTEILPCITKSKSKLLNDLVELIKLDVNVTDSDKTKLLEKAKENTLAEFLTNVFLFVVQQPNDLEKQNNKLKISLFEEYLENAKNKYNMLKTLLYTDKPRPFYDFYVCPDVYYRAFTGEERSECSNIRVIRNRNFSILPKSSYLKLFFEISPFLIITGTGGIGKSMMMRHLLLCGVEAFNEARLLPVFVPLKDFSSTEVSLFEHIYLKIQCLSESFSKELFKEILCKGSCILLFDGLDEISSESIVHFERELDAFVDKYPRNRFVLSSRPYQSFVSFSRFCVVELHPLDKKQALELVDKLEFRLDEPEIKEKFRNELKCTLYHTHKSFIENPLLLTIMLLTFERFAEVPSKRHIFYHEAFLALAATHDASKGAYKRSLKTGLTVDNFASYFAEICFRSYREEKYEFSHADFVRYFNESNRNVLITASDFIYDATANLCIIYKESRKYYFIHRSFQEYFCALFLSKQKDKFIIRLGDFFEKKQHIFTDRTFDMLYDMIPDKIEEYVFVPFLSKLFKKCDDANGYWTFLQEMYPIVFYEHGEVKGHRVNFPKSNLFYLLRFNFNSMILKKLVLTTSDLPFYESFVIEKYRKNPLSEDEFDEEEDYFDEEEYFDDNEYAPNVVGYTLKLEIRKILENKDCYKDIVSVLDNDKFIYKKQYLEAREFLEKLKEKQKTTDDSLLELL